MAIDNAGCQRLEFFAMIFKIICALICSFVVGFVLRGFSDQEELKIIRAENEMLKDELNEQSNRQPAKKTKQIK